MPDDGEPYFNNNNIIYFLVPTMV